MEEPRIWSLDDGNGDGLLAAPASARLELVAHLKRIELLSLNLNLGSGWFASSPRRV